MTTLRGITWNHTRGYAPMAVTAQMFIDRHPGVEINWDRRSLWAFGEGSLADVAEAYDLLVVDHPLMGWAATAGALLELDTALPADVFAAFHEQAIGSSQASYEYDGHYYALAIDAACQVAVARADLLGGLDEDAPETWDDVLPLAKRTGKVAIPFNGIDAFSAFLGLCAHFDAPAGYFGPEYFVDRTAGTAAIELLAELAVLVDPACATANPIATLNRMAYSDDVVYCPLVFGYTNYGRDGYAPNQLTFYDIPASGGRGPHGSCLGGAGLAISASSRQRELALEYARVVADPTTQRTDYVRAGGQPAARTAWEDAEANRLTGDFFRRTRRTIESAYVRPRHPGFPDFQTAAANIVREAILSHRPGAAKPVPVLDQLDELYRASFSVAADTGNEG